MSNIDFVFTKNLGVLGSWNVCVVHSLNVNKSNKSGLICILNNSYCHILIHIVYSYTNCKGIIIHVETAKVGCLGSFQSNSFNNHKYFINERLKCLIQIWILIFLDKFLCINRFYLCDTNYCPPKCMWKNNVQSIWLFLLLHNL